MPSFIGTAHALWRSLSDIDVSESFFNKNDDLMKSKHWIMKSMESKFSTDFLKRKSASSLWMQTYYMKDTVKISGLETVMLHIDKPKSDTQAVEIKKLIKVLVTTLKLCAETFGPAPTPLLEVIVMLDDVKKKIPASKLLTKSHINSGFTNSGREPIVAVYRAEECHKVLIHELMHFWNIHGHDSGMELPAYVPRGALLFETYVETIATVVTCAYCSGNVDAVKKRIADEAIHSEKTRVRIQQCDYGDTNAWAYFVGKCFIMRTLDKFISEFERNPGMHRPEQWRAFVATLTYGRDIEFPVKQSKRVSGNVRMVSCDPE